VCLRPGFSPYSGVCGLCRVVGLDATSLVMSRAPWLICAFIFAACVWKCSGISTSLGTDGLRQADGLAPSGIEGIQAAPGLTTVEHFAQQGDPALTAPWIGRRPAPGILIGVTSDVGGMA